MKNLTAEHIEAHFHYRDFIPYLAQILANKITVPQRGHFDMADNTLLLMPAWNEKFCGVKIATACPGNREIGKPTIHAVYTLFDVKTGEPLAQMDGKVLTNKRTAAASALASQFLSRQESSRLLIMGNGALSTELIRAHAAVRPVDRVEIWGRKIGRVKAMIDGNDWGHLVVSVCENLQKSVAHSDIISCCTSTIDPILEGQWLVEGTHIDLVGSYRPEMREADDEVIHKSKLFIDNPTAVFECGDMAIPLKNDIIQQKDLLGTLEELASGRCQGRSSNEEITLFKSVGFALEDLAAAIYLLEKQDENN